MLTIQNSLNLERATIDRRIGRGAVVMAITLMLVGSIRVYEVDILLVDMMVVLVQPVLLQRLKPPMVLLALGLALLLLVLVLDMLLDMLLDLLLLCPCLLDGCSCWCCWINDWINRRKCEI